MNGSKNQTKPFLIGICGGSASGKKAILKQITNYLTDFSVCTISLESYYKTPPEEFRNKPEEYNFYLPEAIDFELLIKHIIALRNGDDIEMPIFDFANQKRKAETKHISSSPVIIFEGVLAFYDKRIRNLMDLKIFIATGGGERLSRRILRDICERGQELETIVTRYHKFIKTAEDNYFIATKKYADIIIPRGDENAPAARIVSEYLKVQLNKILNGDMSNLFSSINEVVDPKHQFYDKLILVTDEPSEIEFFKQVFEDLIAKEIDDCFIDNIREKFISMLPEILIKYFRNKSYFNENLPKIDLIITEYDDLEKIEWSKYKNILFFKTVILTEEDMKIPEIIFSNNKKCIVIVNTIFLAPKFAEILLGNKLNTLMMNTLYFSDFFIKFEHLIRKDETVYNSKILAQLFSKKLTKVFLDKN